jgi:WD40 repeat protein
LFWEPAGAVTLWNWQTGQRLHRFDRPGRVLALSDDGRRLAIAGPNTGLTVWDTTTGKRLRDCPTENPVWSLSFSPGGRRLLSAGWSSEVSLWALDAPSPPQIISGSQLHVWSAVFSANGATIATTSSDQTVRLWDATTLQLQSTLHGHNSEVWCAAFSPDGQFLATGGKDQTVRLWPVTPARPPAELPHDAHFRPVASPDGKWLVTVNPASGNSMLWQTDNRALAAPNLAAGRPVIGFSRDGRRVVTLARDPLTLQFWRPQGQVPEREVALEGRTPSPAPIVFTGMSPGQELFFAIDATGSVALWDTDTGRLGRVIQGPLPPVRNAVLSPHGRQLAVSVETENIAHLYDCATGAERQLAGHGDFVSGLAFSPDGALLATGSMDGTIRLWDTGSGQSIASLPGHMQETTEVAFSPDGRTLASLGREESLKLWHLPTLREVVSEKEPQAGNWLRFLSDGHTLAVEVGSARLRLLAAPAE